MKPSKTLILGIGNSILSDDSVGIKLAELLQQEFLPPGVDVMTAETGGLDLLNLLTGYHRLIILDALQTNGQPGTVYKLSLEDLPHLPLHHATLAHELDLATTLQLGYKLNLDMPTQISIIAVEAQDVTTFSEELTPKVRQALPSILQDIKSDINALTTPGLPEKDA